MATVWIPPQLRDLTGGQETVQVAGANVRQVIDALDGQFPGVSSRLCDDQGLHSGIAVAVDTQIARLGLLQPVSESSEVHFLPAIAGGTETDEPAEFPPEEPVSLAYICTVCNKQGEGTVPGQQLCPACREEFHQWLAGVLQPVCKEGEDPVKKLYCFPRE
jgi:molybdopterin converting factor small subunit